MWDLPGPEVEPVFPALADGFLTTVQAGKSRIVKFKWVNYMVCELYLNKAVKKSYGEHFVSTIIG